MARAQRAEHAACRGVLVGDGEDEVARLGARRRHDAVALGRGEMARQRPVEVRPRLAVDDPEPGQARGARAPWPARSARRGASAATIRRRERSSALTSGRRERLDLGALEHGREVDQLHPEAQVGLVRAVAVERIGPRHALDRRAGAPRWRPRPHRARLRRRSPSRRPGRRRSTPCRAAMNSNWRSARRSSSRRQRAIWK